MAACRADPSRDGRAGGQRQRSDPTRRAMNAPVLRAYQRAVIADIWAAIEAGQRRIVLVAPTGSGKTVIAAELIGDAVAQGKRVLFLVHRRELVDQSAK